MKATSVLLLATLALTSTLSAAEKKLPNIVWLSSEDHGPHLGCYGDPVARTPHADALASIGTRYRFAWSCAPVCAPARTTLISGMYPPSQAAEHMRSLVPTASQTRLFPALLRKKGYFCTNNAKEDYNLKPTASPWDESSKKAHWSHRKEGQPFFAVFNSEKSHESRIRSRPHTLTTNPDSVRIPAYHPDTPEVRHDWAQYHDGVNAADADAGERLRELRDAGLLDSTIVFQFADHGSGMPRNKRWPGNSGLRVPLIVHIPEAFKHLRPADYSPGGASDRPVSFVDFAATVLSLADIPTPSWMHGHSFLGTHAAAPQPFVHGFRGRMDERIDLVRSVSDGRFVYLRNFLPHLPAGQHVSYQFQTPTTRVWFSLWREGRLNAAQRHFWETPRTAEELYDLESDPDEVNNLAALPDQQPRIARFRDILQTHLLETDDAGFIPEAERIRITAGRPWLDCAADAAFQSTHFPKRDLLAAASDASNPAADAATIAARLDSPIPAIRYWGATGLRIHGTRAITANAARLSALLSDPSPSVQVAAANALARSDSESAKTAALETLRSILKTLETQPQAVFEAAAALDELGAPSEPIRADLAALRKTLESRGKDRDGRYAGYTERLTAHLLGDD
jgi:uncharacterized sulfatase